MPKLISNKISWWVIFSGSLFLMLSLYLIRQYLAFSLLPLSFIVFYFFIAKVESESKQINYFNLLISLILLCLFVHFHSKSFLFFSLLFFILELYAHYKGRIRYQVFFLYFFCSPLFSFLGKLLGFPLRIQLTKLAAQLLSYCHKSISVAGNSIVINGADFIVDEACAGLNMLFASMIWGFISLEFHSIKVNKNLSFIAQVSFYVVVLILNLIGNVSRITLLILFKIYPESSMHQILGLTAFVLYSLIPIYFLSKIWLLYIGKSQHEKIPIKINEKKSSNFLIGFACVGIVLLSYQFMQTQPKQVATSLNMPSTYVKEAVNAEVTKYADSHSLIYIKTMSSFLSGEHSPLICWVGSGYEAKKFVEVEIKGVKLYTGILEKGDQKLYTAWYYSNGHDRTNSPWLWRIKSLQRAGNFYLVNLTSASRKELDNLLDELVLKI